MEASTLYNLATGIDSVQYQTVSGYVVENNCITYICRYNHLYCAVMSYIINTDDFAVNFLPSKKRLPIYKAWVKNTIKPITSII